MQKKPETYDIDPSLPLDITVSNALREKPRRFDWITDMLIPACILGMGSSFAYFLIELRAAWSSAGADVLRYACFWFLMALVLISRMRTKYGGVLGPVFYQIALAGAMFLFMLRYTETVGAIAGNASLASTAGLIINCVIIAIAWWGISRLTDECTVEEDTVDESEEGLLTGLAKKKSGNSSLRPEDLAHERRRRRRHPGRLVIYFAIGALLVFGLSQKALAAGGNATAERAFRFMVAYIFFALVLLALTSLSGLRLYLRKRELRMEPSLPHRWIVASAGLVIGLLLLAAAMPRLAAEGRQWIAIHASGIGKFTQQELQIKTLVEGFRSPKGDTRTALDDQSGEKWNAQQPIPAGKQYSKQAGKGEGKAQSKQGGSPEIGAEQVNKNLAGQAAGKEGGKDTGEQQSGQGKGDSPSGNQDAIQPKQGHPQHQEQQGKHQQGQTQKNGPNQTQKPDSQNVRQDREGSHQKSQVHRSSLLMLLARLVSMLAILAAVVAGLVYLVRHWQAVREWVQRTLRIRLPAFLPCLTMLRKRLHALRQRLRLPQWVVHRRAAGAQPGRLHNPFADSRFFETSSPPDRVRQAYERFLAYAAMRGFPRQEHWTPLEFLRRLPDSLAYLREEAMLLTQLYVVASYTPMELTSADVERLKAPWERLREDASQFLAANAS